MRDKGLVPDPSSAAEGEAASKLIADLGLVSVPNKKYLSSKLRGLYSIYEYRHATALLQSEFPVEFKDICNALENFSFTDEQIRKSGGNESDIPKTISASLRPKGWNESKLRAQNVVDEKVVSVDTHKIDYVKGKVAFDLEWNAKDQTFDRDLSAFRTFFEYGRISVGVLVTRDLSLNQYFIGLGAVKNNRGEVKSIIAKYGASTTHMGKLLPRLNAGRSGGCPVLAFGITPALRK